MSGIEEADENMLVRSEWESQRQDFLEYINSQEHIIEDIVRYHLSLRDEQTCTVAQSGEWLHGTFNVCIPISVSGHRQRLLIRCPLPHRFSNDRAPDLAEEKLRTEAASFAWIAKYCTRVPIPILRGVGLPNGLTLTPSEESPNLHGTGEQDFPREPQGAPLWRPFTPRREISILKSGYLLMDFIEKDRGEPLARKGPPPTADLRQIFMRSLVEIVLDMGRPLDRIGAFFVHDSGEVSLSNRPLTSALAILENDGIATISRTNCYTNTIPYFTELLDCHDSRLQHQPNAVRDEDDAAGQMAVVAILRSLLTNFTQRDLRQGPFVFQMTDLNPSNIFVDDEYKITAICDLEWSCSLPLEMLHPPIWLSGHHLDDFLDEEVEKRENCNERFNELCKTFARLLAEGRNHMACPGPIDGSEMSSSAEKGSHFYFAALRNPHAAYNIFHTQLQPFFAPEQMEGHKCVLFQEIVAPYWCRNFSSFIARKTKEKESYITLLRAKRQQK